MSGSLVWRTYTTDGAVPTSVFRDESNSEATIGGTTLLSAFAAGNGGLSSLIKPRYVNAYLSTDPNRRKRFVIGTIALYNTITTGTQITEGAGAGSLTWNVSSKVGERARIPTSVDTGQTDGDPT